MKGKIFVTFEVLSVILLMILVLWDVMLCQWVSSYQYILKMEALQMFAHENSDDLGHSGGRGSQVIGCL
jgi:hypothetical protein